MKNEGELRGFLKELVEFISLIRASEKERYEVQKNFMEDTVKAMKEISESIKATGEYIRTSNEKMKEILKTGIDTIRKEMNIDTIVEAKNVLSEAIDILQRESQLIEFRQTIYDIRTSLEKLQLTSNPQSALTKNSIPTKEDIKSPSTPDKLSETIDKSEIGPGKPNEKEKKKKSDSKEEKYHIEF